jgi:hypothetical protein
MLKYALEFFQPLSPRKAPGRPKLFALTCPPEVKSREARFNFA